MLFPSGDANSLPCTGSMLVLVEGMGFYLRIQNT